MAFFQSARFLLSEIVAAVTDGVSGAWHSISMQEWDYSRCR